ncbi:MAG: NAD-binding protein [Streptosporangiales bacterium]|nr:NAD-binding protein [Streptosporangiales bacterium]
MSPPARTAGFVGLGVMGSAMSGHLLASGYRVVGYDIDPTRLAEHEARGGEAAGSAAEVATRVAEATSPPDPARGGAIVTSLPSTRALEEVAAEIAVPGTVVVETSTLPLAARFAARDALAARDVTLLDCPLSGTGAQARTKDIAVYVSGDDAAAKERALPVLEAFTRSRHDAGPFGNGTRLKIVANLLVAVHSLAAAEALLLARRLGLDADEALAALTDGAGDSRMLRVRGPMMISGAYRDPAAAMMRIELFLKDLGIIAEAAAGAGSPVPLLEESAAHYTAAAARGRGDLDVAGVLAELEAGERPDHP